MPTGPEVRFAELAAGPDALPDRLRCLTGCAA